MMKRLPVVVAMCVVAGSVAFGRTVNMQGYKEMMEKADPDYRERFRITNKVMMEELIPLLTRVEPEVREALVRAYARKFSAEQLTELNRFFATPAGRYYASESMITFVDPEVTSLMGKLGPDVVREMPRIMEKVKAATAHLRPPSAKASTTKP